MQAAIATSFRSAVDPSCASHVKEARYFPCFMPELLLHNRTGLLTLLVSAYKRNITVSTDNFKVYTLSVYSIVIHNVAYVSLIPCRLFTQYQTIWCVVLH